MFKTKTPYISRSYMTPSKEKLDFIRKKSCATTTGQQRTSVKPKTTKQQMDAQPV